MFCENCGKELTDDIRFCPECGTEIHIPYPGQESPKKGNLNYEFNKKQEPFVSKKKVTTEKKKAVTSQASRLGYNYNWGHILAAIGSVLEIVSLFLPNKTKFINGITMWEYLQILAQHILESFSEPRKEDIFICLIIFYLALLFISCIQLNTDSLIITSIINIVIVGYIFHQYNVFPMEIDIDNIGKSLHDLKRVHGMGYWLFLSSGITILVSAVIAKMLSINEKSKASSKTI